MHHGAKTTNHMCFHFVINATNLAATTLGVVFDGIKMTQTIELAEMLCHIPLCSCATAQAKPTRHFTARGLLALFFQKCVPQFVWKKIVRLVLPLNRNLLPKICLVALHWMSPCAGSWGDTPRLSQSASLLDFYLSELSFWEFLRNSFLSETWDMQMGIFGVRLSYFISFRCDSWSW